MSEEEVALIEGFFFEATHVILGEGFQDVESRILVATSDEPQT